MLDILNNNCIETVVVAFVDMFINVFFFYIKFIYIIFFLCNNYFLYQMFYTDIIPLQLQLELMTNIRT